MKNESLNALRGDLAEEYAEKVRALGAFRARLWYWREIAAMTAFATSPWIAFATAVGTLAGIGAYAMGTIPVRGPLPLLPYAAVVLLPIALFRIAGVQSFAMRFCITLLTFMVTTVVHYFAIYMFAPGVGTISLWGHTWRLGFMLGIGLILSFAAAVVAGRLPDRTSWLAVTALGTLGGGAFIVTLWTTGLSWVLAADAFVLLAAAAIYIRNQRIRAFLARTAVAAGVSGIATAFVWFFLNVLVGRAGAIRLWERLSQDGLLYVEILMVSAVIAGFTAPRESGGQSRVATGA